MEKLVRDAIPQIIEEKWESCVFRVASDEEYQRFILEKLVEESEEVKHSWTIEAMKQELADVLEVYDAVLTSYGLSHDEILRIKEEKKKKRGGFDRWIILEQW